MQVVLFEYRKNISIMYLLGAYYIKIKKVILNNHKICNRYFILRSEDSPFSKLPTLGEGATMGESIQFNYPP